MAALALCSVVCFQSCQCSSDTQEKSNADALKSDSTLVVENTISMDRQQMFLEYANDYRWYETCIVVKDFYDEEGAASPTVVGVSNIFQYLTDVDEKSADVHVVLFAHVPDTATVEVKHGFWVGDQPLNNEQIKVTFKDAYDKMMAANYPKPHSRQVVLRKEIGSKDANPQYIFGNSKAQLYVDAVTGAVTDKNPAFDENLTMPLGEWP